MAKAKLKPQEIIAEKSTFLESFLLNNESELTKTALAPSIVKPIPSGSIFNAKLSVKFWGTQLVSQVNNDLLVDFNNEQHSSNTATLIAKFAKHGLELLIFITIYDGDDRVRSIVSPDKYKTHPNYNEQLYLEILKSTVERTGLKVDVKDFTLVPNISDTEFVFESAQKPISDPISFAKNMDSLLGVELTDIDTIKELDEENSDREEKTAMGFFMAGFLYLKNVYNSIINAYGLGPEENLVMFSPINLRYTVCAFISNTTKKINSIIVHDSQNPNDSLLSVLDIDTNLNHRVIWTQFWLPILVAESAGKKVNVDYQMLYRLCACPVPFSIRGNLLDSFIPDEYNSSSAVSSAKRNDFELHAFIHGFLLVIRLTCQEGKFNTTKIWGSRTENNFSNNLSNLPEYETGQPHYYFRDINKPDSSVVDKNAWQKRNAKGMLLAFWNSVLMCMTCVLSPTEYKKLISDLSDRAKVSNAKNIEQQRNRQYPEF